MKKQKATEIDKRFDDGEEVLEYFDLSKIRKPNEEIKRINVDFPIWMVESLDRRAKHLGVNRQSVIKMWIAEKLESNTQ
ncbi:BrnA antitoxin family protein [bacterium]|nr:BrnA antitoxin family protein [bacterium]